VSACAYGRGQLVVADTEGSLYFVNRHLELMCFKAYELNVSHLFQMKQHNILVSIGVSKQIKVQCMLYHFIFTNSLALPCLQPSSLQRVGR